MHATLAIQSNGSIFDQIKSHENRTISYYRKELKKRLDDARANLTKLSIFAEAEAGYPEVSRLIDSVKKSVIISFKK